MIQLIPLIRVISGVAIAYAASIIGLYALFSANPVWDAIAWATGGGTLLNALLLLLVYFYWRKIWRLVPGLNKWIFPDLNGTWSVGIVYVDAKSRLPRTVSATAYITQTILSLNIHLDSENSQSDTLAVMAKKDPQGQPFLHYLYMNTPKKIGDETRAPYEGAATLLLSYSEKNKLSGNYFTAAGTRGRFTFTRT